jgi:hypothetical protein
MTVAGLAISAKMFWQGRNHLLTMAFNPYLPTGAVIC